ncbi:MAG: hypothetical protein JRI68_16285, partial [Deltaproteobacteria bacterium]|nr:hypothetical protein [Deltaproteobacteria bacterium]
MTSTSPTIALLPTLWGALAVIVLALVACDRNRGETSEEEDDDEAPVGRTSGPTTASARPRTASVRPLREAILGEWERLCSTQSAAAKRCLGREDHGLYKTFQPGGHLTMGSRKTGVVEKGTWRLKGEQLVIELGGGGLRIVEESLVRIDGDHLIL